MITKSIVIFALLAASLAFPPPDTRQRRSSPVQRGTPVLYNGAVVEYRPYNDWTHGGERILLENTQTIVEFASKAKTHHADIIVFPEYGLTGGYIGSTDEEVDSIFQYVPNPDKEITPCDEEISSNEHTYDALKNISCTARDLQLYMVVDLIEKLNPTYTEPRRYYNTQVVFDRNGVVIARYRKKNLFFEPMLTPGTDDISTAVFTTDFGVKFALQVCFDILHDEPALLNIINQNITNVIMSTYWYDGFPFLSAPQAFSSWSNGLAANLLVSSYHNPQRGALGSGIFNGWGENQSKYVYNKYINSALIVRTIRTVRDPNEDPDNDTTRTINIVDHVEELFPTENEEIFHYFIHENLVNYTSKILPVTGRNIRSEALCDNIVCCTARYTYTKELPNGENYQLIAYDGIIGSDAGEYQIRVQTCGVVHCLTSSIDSCANVNDPYTLNTKFRLKTLKGTFSSQFVYPSVFTTNFKLSSKFQFRKIQRVSSTEAIMTATPSPDKHLLAATLFSRYYAEDPQ